MIKADFLFRSIVFMRPKKYVISSVFHNFKNS